MTQIAKYFDSVSYSQLFRNLIAGIVVGFIQTIITISVVSLIFQGELKAALPVAIGIGLVSQMIVITIVAVFSKTGGVISSIQDNPAVLMAIMVGGLATSASVEARIATIFILIMLTSLLTGLSFIIIGQFRLGQLGRYIPYPVIGGFLAGTGWLLLKGSFGLMANASLTFTNITTLLQTDELLLWLPGVVFGFALFFGLRRFPSPHTLPALLVGGVVVFYVALLVSQTSITEATIRGLLLSQDDTGIYWQRPQVSHFMQADWRAIFNQTGSIAAIIMLSMVSLLLNISGLELALKTDFELNHEFRTAGFANVFSSLLGGVIGYHGVSMTIINHRVGGRGRFAGILTGLFGLIVLFFGSSLLAYVPRPLLGGIIFFLGLDFLNDWIVEGYKKFSYIDFGIVLLIVLTVAFVDFLTGVTVGLVLTIILFVVNYSRINIFHYMSSGAEMMSNVERTAYHQESLSELGQYIEIIELRGFIFFGTVNHLLGLVRQRYQDEEKSQLQYLLLDFRRVTRIDSSAILGFQKLRHTAFINNFTVLFTHLPEDTHYHFVDEGLDESDDHIQIFSDLDYGLEWCEDALLNDFGITQALISVMLESQLEEQGFDVQLVEPLRQYLERRELEKGDYLMRQSNHASDLYFIEMGQVSVVLELPDNQTMRLRTMQMGTVVGEIGFYLRQKRSASIIADTKVVAYRLSQEALERMKAEQPQLAIALDEMMLRIVADRLARNNRSIEAYNR